MVNDLILIDGQEGFVDLSLIEEWAIKEERTITQYNGYSFKELKTKESGHHTIPVISFQKDNKHRAWGCYVTDNPSDRLMLIGMQISYKNLARIFHKISHEIDERTKKFKDKMNKAKTMTTRAKYNNLIRKLIKEEEQYAEDYFRIIYRLLSKLPVKYHSKEKIIIPLRGRGDNPYLECSIIKIKTIAIPYLESQFLLKRIELDKQEQDMVKSMKELLSIKDDETTFDTYIDKWAERLIKRLETGQL
jgi:hypothetical protein